MATRYELATVDDLAVARDGIAVYATRAALNADLSPADGELARVTRDGTDNGIYVKAGASGSGSWQPYAYDRVAIVERDVDSAAASVRRYPFAPFASHTVETTQNDMFRGILDVQLYGDPPAYDVAVERAYRRYFTGGQDIWYISIRRTDTQEEVARMIATSNPEPANPTVPAEYELRNTAGNEVLGRVLVRWSSLTEAVPARDAYEMVLDRDVWRAADDPGGRAESAFTTRAIAADAVEAYNRAITAETAIDAVAQDVADVSSTAAALRALTPPHPFTRDAGIDGDTALRDELFRSVIDIRLQGAGAQSYYLKRLDRGPANWTIQIGRTSDGTTVSSWSTTTNPEPADGVSVIEVPSSGGSGITATVALRWSERGNSTGNFPVGGMELSPSVRDPGFPGLLQVAADSARVSELESEFEAADVPGLSAAVGRADRISRYHPYAPTATHADPSLVRELEQAFLDIRVIGTRPAYELATGRVRRNLAGVGWQVELCQQGQTSNVVARYLSATNPEPSDPTIPMVITLGEVGGSGITAQVLVRWSELTPNQANTANQMVIARTAYRSAGQPGYGYAGEIEAREVAQGGGDPSGPGQSGVVLRLEPGIMDVYVKPTGPESPHWTHYRFARHTHGGTRADVWTIQGAWEATRMGAESYLDGQRIAVESSEWLCAMREAGKPDSVGGRAHGYEKMIEAPTLLVDGRAVNLGSVSGEEWHEAGEVTITQRSHLLEYGAASDVQRAQRRLWLRWMNGEMHARQRIEWMVPLSLATGYCAMLPMHRYASYTSSSEDTSSPQISGRAMDDLRYEVIDASAYVDESIPWFDGIRTWKLWGTYGTGGELELQNASGPLGNEGGLQRRHYTYNKAYIGFVTQQDVTAGEVWTADTRWRVSGS